MKRLSFIASAAWFALVLPAVAQTSAKIPPASPLPAGGAAVAESDWRAALAGSGKLTEFGGAQSTPDGVKLVTLKQPEHLYSLQANLLNAVPLQKGNTLFARFAARSLQADKATGVTKMQVSFSKASPPYDGSYRAEIGLTSAWQWYEIPFTCKNDFAPREARLTFTYGYPAQAAEVANVEVLRFGPEVALSALPKTKRYADAVSPALLKSEVGRIVALKRDLAAVTDPAPAHGKTLHVATTGSASGDGSTTKPFATIPQALQVVQPGETIQVGAGEYREPQGVSIKKSGRADAWIKIKAAPSARPKIITSSWSGFELRGGVGYVEISGFELEWVAAPGIVAHGVGIAPMYATHHVRAINNIIHGYGTGGICTLDCDYIYLEGNVIYDTAKTSPYGGSAISLCRAFNFDDAPGYHNVVRRNICHDNELKVIVQESSGGNGRTLTDGNGIIIDVFQRSRANPLKPHGEDKNGPLLPYRGRTLVENNLIYDNGGRGIHVFRSEKVDVLNNTCYMNQKSADINAGELTAIEADQVTFFNNIAYGRKEKRANTQDGSSRILWADNLFYNADDVLLHPGVIVGKDPRFVAPGLTAPPDGFRLQNNSPALGKAMVPVAPSNDLSGARRPQAGPIDLGAYQTKGK